MADRELIAATLAAGLLSTAKFEQGAETDPAEYAVAIYQRVLAALAKTSATNIGRAREGRPRG